MSRYGLAHLTDRHLLRDLESLTARDRANTADLLAHLAEVDVRKLYVPAGYPSLFEFCVRELRMCEHAAYKRIRAARMAREYPAIFDAVAEGRLHLSAVVLLAPHLTVDTADGLVAAATHKTKAEVEQLLAERFPRENVVTRVRALPSKPRLSPGIVGSSEVPLATLEIPAQQTEQLAPGLVAPPPRPAKMVPLAPKRYALQVTLAQKTHDKLRHAQALLGHRVPSGDVATVLDLALDALVADLERKKCAATARPKGEQTPSKSRRHIPAGVRRAVWARDAGRCTFVSKRGHRCPSRTRLEFDHIEAVGLGGRANDDNIRLRCQSHNQYAAEITFGRAFMKKRAQESMDRRAERKLSSLRLQL